MYNVTHYVVINGQTSELLPIKSGYFKTRLQISEFETIITQLEQYKHEEKISVNMIHRILIKDLKHS